MAMNELWMNAKEFYWANREACRVAAAGLAFVFAQALILAWTLRRLRELSHIRERMSRLADGLTLLTDTTEAGLSAIVRHLRPADHRTASTRSGSRAATARRIATAASRGDRVSQIAEREALSESEVRLHLALSGGGKPAVDEYEPLAS
jgi:hypothetical protein